MRKITIYFEIDYGNINMWKFWIRLHLFSCILFLNSINKLFRAIGNYCWNGTTTYNKSSRCFLREPGKIFDFGIKDQSQIVVGFYPDVLPPTPNVYFRVYNKAGGKGQSGSGFQRTQIPRRESVSKCWLQFSAFKNVFMVSNRVRQFQNQRHNSCFFEWTVQATDVIFNFADILSIKSAECCDYSRWFGYLCQLFNRPVLCVVR